MKRTLPTIGIEEEYLLVDPATCEPVPVGEALLANSTAPASPEPAYRLQPSLVRSQVEIATGVCSSLDDVRRSLTEARSAVGALAQEVDAVLAPVGVAPGGTAPAAVTPTDRYLDIYELSRGLVEEQVLNGMHIHVQVPNRNAGVTVMNRLRPWVHVLLALSANSPIWRGKDTGFASWRSIHERRWPVQGPPPEFANAADYDERVARILSLGVVLDASQLYWSMRLSERYPTIQIRVSDVQLDVEGAVMLAGLVRALVVRSLRDAALGVSEPRISSEAVNAASWHAARYGVSGELIRLNSGRGPRTAPAEDVVDVLLHHITFGSTSAELDDIMPALAATLTGGSGAERQRRALVTGGLEAVLELVRLTAEAASRHP